MTDIFTPEKRSWVMSRIRGQNTKIDLIMLDMLKSIGCIFTMYPKMYGNPDFLVKNKIIVFCDGDFWHGYKYDEKKKPMTKFWRTKIETNMNRDKKISRTLRRQGYSVLRFWEHDIEKRESACINRIRRKILQSRKSH